MPTLSKPTPIAGPFAYNGDKNTIPDTTATAGAASYQQGFPPVTQLPLTAGGIAPQRNDFNGILNALSQHIYWVQSGGVYDWSAARDYPQYAIILASDGRMYRALKASGPGVSGVGAKNPTAAASAAYWELLPVASDITSPYELCEFYFFRHPTLRPGFQPAQGGLLTNAATKYPEAWAYLQTTEGRKLCKTESEWQAMTKATWTTLADGTRVGWNGIGGAPYYAPNTATGALRLPDLRGMYAEAAGYDAFGVGCVHGDMIRNIASSVTAVCGEMHSTTGAFYAGLVGTGAQLQVANAEYVLTFDPSRVVPVGSANKPRAWGALACVYLGPAAS